MGAVRSIISLGTSGIPVDIECHISNSLPNIVIVGFANKTVDESKERLRGAFTNSGLKLPKKRISVNLAPADVPKDGSSLDLAIATAILATDKQFPSLPQKTEAFIGELGLDGTIRPVRGIIGKLLSGRSSGIQRFYIPSGNLAQAQMVPHIELVPLQNLKELYLHLTNTKPLDTLKAGSGLRVETEDTSQQSAIDDIIGQMQAKRAIEIAAAGGHNILLSGPPGTGKSMLAKAFASLLPPLSHEEMLEVTHLHSLAGHEYEKLVTSRPLRAPHHSASHISIVGGGNNVRPGEISLSHRGVLFFDELPEFSRSTIEALRQPLEDKTITVSRAKESVEYPANFIFVATANPCPCGYYGSDKACECSPHQINQYRRKLSGPLLDRIDICVNVDSIEHEKLLAKHSGKKAAPEVRRRITTARARQAMRFKDTVKLNSDMTNYDLRHLSGLTPSAKRLLDLASQRLGLSARGYMRSVKVARTIADMDGSVNIEESHISEALQFRSQAALDI
jgi:magnesium chelatase family protein